MALTPVLEDQLWGLYTAYPKHRCTPASFQHPAKMAWRLCAWIMQHLRDEAWAQPGDMVCDPMAGIGTTLLSAADAGLMAIGIELEPHFMAEAQANIALNTRVWKRLGKPIPRIVQGDAGNLLALVQEAGMVVSSPPYADGCAHTGGTDAHPELIQGGHTGHVLQSYNYGLPPTTSQLGALPMGNVQAVISSPPWEKNADGSLRKEKFKDPEAFAAAMSAQDRRRGRNGTTAAMRLVQMERDAGKSYGTAEGQIGNKSGETYWSAMKTVYEQYYAMLPVGGHIVLTLKGFIRKRQYVDLPGQTAQLLEHLGFTVLHMHRAMLIAQTAQLTLDGGEERTSRKSFFRRLCEAKGSPAIDWETVLCCVKESYRCHGKI